MQADEMLHGIATEGFLPNEPKAGVTRTMADALKAFPGADSSAATAPVKQVITIDTTYIADDHLRAAVLQKKREGLDLLMGIERRIQAHQGNEAAPALIMRTLNSLYHQEKMKGMSEQARQVYLNNHTMQDATSVASSLFVSRVMPDESVWQEMDSLYTVEDAQRIRGRFMQSLQYWLEYKAVPPINESDLVNIPGYKINQEQHFFLQDYEWLNTWREFLKNNPQPHINTGDDEHWRYRMNEIQRQIAEFKAAHPEPTPPARDETAAKPAEESESIQEARESLQKDLQEISLVGTESVIPARRTYVEDFVKERARLNYQPLPRARIPEAIDNWLRQAVVPVVLEILKDPQEGDADIIDQLGKLCTTQQFDTIIGSVKQNLWQK